MRRTPFWSTRWWCMGPSIRCEKFRICLWTVREQWLLPIGNPQDRILRFSKAHVFAADHRRKHEKLQRAMAHCFVYGCVERQHNQLWQGTEGNLTKWSQFLRLKPAYWFWQSLSSFRYLICATTQVTYGIVFTFCLFGSRDAKPSPYYPRTFTFRRVLVTRILRFIPH